MLRKALTLIGAVALGACQQDVQPVASGSAPIAGNFDGIYRGTFTLTHNGSGQCGSTVINRTMTVRANSGSLAFNPSQGFVATGMIREDGSFSLIGQTVGRVTIAGRIENGTVNGTFDSNQCKYDVALRRGR